MRMLPNVKVYLSTVFTDMRKSFNGLAYLVSQDMKKDPISGELFVFISRRGDIVKSYIGIEMVFASGLKD